MEVSRRSFCAGLGVSGLAFHQNAVNKAARYVRYDMEAKFLTAFSMAIPSERFVEVFLPLEPKPGLKQSSQR